MRGAFYLAPIASLPVRCTLIQSLGMTFLSFSLRASSIRVPLYDPKERLACSP